MSRIIIDNGVSGSDFTELNLTRFTQLRSLVIGDHCLSYVTMVKLIGMSELESVVIGMRGFTKYKNTNDITADPNRQFYLKNCPKLKSLKIGRYSFSDYTVIEIENCGLEVIEIGDLNVNSPNFYYASMELNSILIHSE